MCCCSVLLRDFFLCVAVQYLQIVDACTVAECCSVLLQCAIKLCCCSVLLRCVVAVRCCRVLLQCFVAVCHCCNELQCNTCRSSTRLERPQHFKRPYKLMASSLVRHPLCVAVCCSVLQRVTACCSVVQYGAVWCSVVQCGAVCCSVLQYTN